MSAPGETVAGNSHLPGEPATEILVLVADRSRARLFRVSENENALVEIMDLVNSEARATENELVRDRQGRGLYGGVRGRQARRATFGKSGSKRYLSAEHFAARICEAAANHARNAVVQQLYVIASPDLMGMIRPHLQILSSQIPVGEIPKNITRQDIATIRSYLPKTLWPRRVEGVALS